MSRAIISGCGGGYDAYFGIPLFYRLRQQHIQPIVASLSLQSSQSLHDYVKCGVLTKISTVCFRVNAAEVIAVITRNFPEYHLSRALGEPVYILGTFGTIQNIVDAYRAIIKHHGRGRVRSIYLMEGGCDAVLSGRETCLGTPEEDYMHLKAVVQLRIPEKRVCAIGMNVDQADGIKEDEMLERMAFLRENGALVGVERWTRSRETMRKYCAAIKRSNPRNSIVNSLVLAAMEGKTGKYTPPQLVGRIGKSRVSIGELTRTMHTYALDDLVKTMVYMDRLSNDMSFKGVRKCIAETN